MLKINEDAAVAVRNEDDADVGFCAPCQSGYWLTTDELHMTRLNKLLKQHIINDVRK